MKKRLAAVTTFGIAFGFIEAAVVVYLRLHFYPEGFTFPLAEMPGPVILTEVAREAATIIMLACIGWIAGRRFLDRFAYFAFAFGVWDIFYYVFLKVILGWPESLLTWDVLFLIPSPGWDRCSHGDRLRLPHRSKSGHTPARGQADQ